MEKIDYLAIGHISDDISSEGARLGGTVSFSGRVAQVLGCQTAVFTSAAPDHQLPTDLPGIALHCVPAAHTTTFENIYNAQGRRHQILHKRAAPLRAADLPAGWDRARIVHLGPIADEIESGMIAAFSDSLVGLTPQGWMRQWDENGRVFPKVWGEATAVLPLAAATIIGEDDFHDPAILTQFRQWSRLLVLTQGGKGCTVFLNDETRHFPAEPVSGPVETTGAGDSFATAFFVRLLQTDGNAWEAAQFANKIAACSVTQTDIAAKIAAIEAHYATIY